MARIDNRTDGRWRPLMWGGAVLLFLAPLVATRFSAEMDWSAADFAIFGAMLIGFCSAYELAQQITRRPAYRALVAVGLAVAFLLAWAHLAVGVF